ncbi:MAG: GGDEF domain-containing protein [Treponemataceae bacterium]|nr:GGDEF domain-containing protein [Treponemataceae bacterium]
MDWNKVSSHTFKFAVVLSFVFLLGIIAVSNMALRRSIEDIYVLNAPFEVSENGEASQIVSLNEFRIASTNRLDTVSFTYTLPEMFDDPYTIMPTVFLCSIEAFVDGEKIYSYGTDLVAANEMIGSGMYFIDIPGHSGGKKLTLVIQQNEKDGTTVLMPFRAVPTGKELQLFIVEKLFITIISILLIGLGLLFCTNGMLISLFNGQFLRLVNIGLLSILIGMWALSNNQVTSVFTQYREVLTQTEYLVLYFVPVPMGILLYQLAEVRNGWRKNALFFLTCWCFLFFVGTTVLHYSNVVRYPHTLIPFHINSLVCSISGLFIAYGHRQNKTNAQSMFIFALGIFCSMLILDVVRFNIVKYLIQPRYEIITSFLPVAMLQFVIMAFVGFLIPIYDKAMSIDERNLLSRLAYTDTLTGLNNRTKCYEVFKVLDRSKANYMLINFDVNGLKFINDTCGHQAGDKLLYVFATCLQDSFGDIGRCFRMGGDEFLVLVQTDAKPDIEAAMKSLRSHAASRSRLWSFSLRYAYGIARRSDVEDGLADSVYKLSDERMYEMKMNDQSSRTFSELQYYESMRAK